MANATLTMPKYLCIPVTSTITPAAKESQLQRGIINSLTRETSACMVLTNEFAVHFRVLLLLPQLIAGGTGTRV